MNDHLRQISEREDTKGERGRRGSYPKMDFMFCTADGQTSISRLWNSLKENCPLPGKIALTRMVSDKADSSECFDLAREWLSDCAQNHENCARPPDPCLPTRVIDVGPQDGSTEPFLYITGSQGGRYATLSHCWGRLKRFVTTTKNRNDSGPPLCQHPFRPTPLTN